MLTSLFVRSSFFSFVYRSSTFPFPRASLTMSVLPVCLSIYSNLAAKSNKRAPVKSKAWVLAKKSRNALKSGQEVKNSKYTARNRKARF